MFGFHLVKLKRRSQKRTLTGLYIRTDNCTSSACRQSSKMFLRAPKLMLGNFIPSICPRTIQALFPLQLLLYFAAGNIGAANSHLGPGRFSDYIQQLMMLCFNPQMQPEKLLHLLLEPVRSCWNLKRKLSIS